MINAGGLIKLHYHKNLDLLELFSDINQVLYYRDKSLFWNLELSQLDHNHLVKKNDGLFVDGTFIDRFDYHNQELYFDDIIVSREYTDEKITSMINSIWATNPYLEIGKIDLSYWLILTYITNKILVYENTSDTTMNLIISNPHNQLLQLNKSGTITNNNSNRISIALLSSQTLTIKDNDQNDLQDISVTLQ